ncbi:MAG: hypothetical protein EOP52_14000 [Sphingobacteriales bacterium]|nr:MAG: hypothetical protein EOP52_14000 [Sphingobacteriales bacterium]
MKNKRKLKSGFKALKSCSFLLAFASLVAACDRRTPQQALEEEARRLEACKDEPWCGNVTAPTYDAKTQARLKRDDRWFLAPIDYQYNTRLAFYWPSKRPIAVNRKESDAQDWMVFLLPRSHDIPPEPRGYGHIQEAEKTGRLLERVALRPGLDRVRYIRATATAASSSDRSPVTVYIATEKRTPDGRSPVLACALTQDPSQAGGGAGFVWKERIYVEILIRAGNVCEEWPEIYDEIERVLNLTKEA